MGRSRMLALVEAIVLGVMSGLLVWHAVSWHVGGVYGEMYNDIVQGGSLLPVFYNLGFIVVLALVLGLFMERVTSIMGYRVTRIRHFEEGKE